MSEVFNNLSLNEACREQHELVLAKGFEKENIPTLMMLVVTELSEAVEADRKNRHADLSKFNMEFPLYGQYEKENYFKGLPSAELREAYRETFERNIKDTFEDEIADAFLRLMHLCGAYGIDIEKHIRMKAEYNKLRPSKHGKAY